MGQLRPNLGPTYGPNNNRPKQACTGHTRPNHSNYPSPARPSSQPPSHAGPCSAKVPCTHDPALQSFLFSRVKHSRLADLSLPSHQPCSSCIAHSPHVVCLLSTNETGFLLASLSGPLLVTSSRGNRRPLRLHGRALNFLASRSLHNPIYLHSCSLEPPLRVSLLS